MITLTDKTRCHSVAYDISFLSLKYRHVYKSSLRVQWRKHRHDESLRSALVGYVLEPLHSLFKDSKPLLNRLSISKYCTLPPSRRILLGYKFRSLYEQTLRDYKLFSAPLIGKLIAEAVPISIFCASFYFFFGRSNSSFSSYN